MSSYKLSFRIAACFVFGAACSLMCAAQPITTRLRATLETRGRSPMVEQRLAYARQQYFANLQGDRAAGDRARSSFADLSRDLPGDPVVQAYSGSLELLEGARTWAVWDKRRLANEGLQKMDAAVDRAPGDLEARFIRAASTWHLPFFYKRHDQAVADFTLIAPRAEAAVTNGTLPPNWRPPRWTTTARY